MELITGIVETAKEVYEATKKIQQVFNVSKEMKNVAESEGTDQIVATKDLASSTKKLTNESSNKESSSKGDLKGDEKIKESHISSPFVEKLDSSTILKDPKTDGGVFVDKFPGTDAEVDDKIIQSETPEIAKNPEVKNSGSISDVNQVEKQPLESNNSIEIGETTNIERQGLTEEEKNEIKEKTGWSDRIVDAIRTKEEAQIYLDAGLVEGEVNGIPALLQPRIDGNACNEPKWPDWSNKDLAEEGYPPRDANGRPYELHHIGQNPDSPLAELTYEQHHCNGNFKILHTFEESSIDRLDFNKERRIYWEERSNTL